MKLAIYILLFCVTFPIVFVFWLAWCSFLLFLKLCEAKERLSFLFLIVAFSSSAQIIPPMVQGPVVVQHKVPVPQPIELSWSPSVSPYVQGYTITGSTNGVIFESTNVTGMSCTLLAWPGTNTFQVEAYNSVAHSAPAVLSHSGWYHGNTLNLSVVSNGATWTNIACADESILTAPTFFRVAIGDAVVMQESPSLAFNSTLTLFASDIDNFPSIAAYKPIWIPYVKNIP